MKTDNKWGQDLLKFTPKGSFRRWIRRVYSRWMRSRKCHCANEIEMLFNRLNQMEELIDIIAREMARQNKRGK